jgi:FMN-dependent NADH-azoreductase
MAFFAQPEMRTPEQQAFIDESDRLIEEISDAHVVVIGLPMYNFGIRTPVRAYYQYGESPYQSKPKTLKLKVTASS